AQLRARTLYVVGGLYGNRQALAALCSLAEPDATLVFNGDFNWFNVDPAGFPAVNDAVLRHVALRGNVETELASDDERAGCGCAYPESVSDADVERSNRILQRLRNASRAFPALRDRLAALPMYCVAEIDGCRVAIVHGDFASLAGWRFAHDSLHAPDAQRWLAELFPRAGVSLFASSHTCLPALRELVTADGPRAVINNGTAGMPNFSAATHGVVTRISTRPARPELRLYGTVLRGVFVDAIRVDYDHAAFVREFRANWPEESDAHVSYFRRIVNGPDFSVDQ